MKTFLAFLVLVSNLGFGFNDDLQWQDILDVHAYYGHSCSMNAPLMVLRPYRGDWLRISIPTYCQPTQIRQMAFWGVLGTGQTARLGAVLVSTASDYSRLSWTYQVNGGLPASIRLIGLDVMTADLNGCPITFEQALSQNPLPPAIPITPGPDPAPPQPPTTPVVSPNPVPPQPPATPVTPPGSVPSQPPTTPVTPAPNPVPPPTTPVTPGPGFTEWRRGDENSCMITARLTQQLCSHGFSPTQFKVECH